MSTFTTLKLRMRLQGQPDKEGDIAIAHKDVVMIPNDGSLEVRETVVGGRDEDALREVGHEPTLACQPPPRPCPRTFVSWCIDSFRTPSHDRLLLPFLVMSRPSSLSVWINLVMLTPLLTVMLQ